MKSPSLPTLGPNVKYLGKRTGPDEEYCRLDGLTFKRLVGRYRVDDFLVEIGWVVDYKLGSFREPHQLTIQFDSEDFGIKVASEQHSQHASALNGITTSVLRSIPMAHARALMRDRHEQLSVAALKDEITPLPARVDSEADYVHVSCAYVALGSCSVEPIKRLAEWTGESVDTWSARLRRARAKGILEGRGRNSRIAPSYLRRSNEFWMKLRAHKDNRDGSH